MCEVRVLTTTSSVLTAPAHHLLTQWLWYWQDEGGHWVEYGSATQVSSGSVPGHPLGQSPHCPAQYNYI